MDKEESYRFELDSNAMEIVLRSFSYLNDNYYHTHIVDQQRLLVNKVDVEHVIAILESVSTKKQDVLTIQMTRYEWYGYQNMVSYTPLALPTDRGDDMDFLEHLNETYMDREDYGSYKI